MVCYSNCEVMCVTIGQRIKGARKNAGLTQRALAEKIGVATGTIQQYELGKRQPRIGQLGLIANALGVSALELTGLQDYGDGFHAEPDLKQTTVDAVKARISELKEDAQCRQRLNDALDRLNPDGQEKAVERVEELTEIPRYQATAATQSPPAPPEGQTTPPPDAPETVSEDE